MKVLLVEDEQEIASSIIAYLQSQHALCEWVTTIENANEKINLYHYDCILLDLMLPDGSGISIVDAIKSTLNHSTGIIILSAIETLEMRIEALKKGADDYLTKPFHLSELLVRIQALVRRKHFHGSNILTYGELEIDIFGKEAKVAGTKIDLTRKEFDLLLLLLTNANKVVSKSTIAEQLTGDMADLFDNYDFVYAHIKNIKKKLAKHTASEHIVTVYGIGYKWKNEA